MLTGLPTDFRNQPKGLKFPGISGFSSFAVVRKPASVYAHPHARWGVYLAWWSPVVGGFGISLLAGTFRAALSSCRALWALVCKLVVNVLWRAVLLGQQKGRLNRAAHGGLFCPVVGHLNAMKGCAIINLIARRTDVQNQKITRLNQRQGGMYISVVMINWVA